MAVIMDKFQLVLQVRYGAAQEGGVIGGSVVCIQTTPSWYRSRLPGGSLVKMKGEQTTDLLALHHE